MEFYYKNALTIVEGDFGFELHLVRGWWERPLEIKAKFSQDLHAHLQALLIRKAVEFAREDEWWYDDIG